MLAIDWSEADNGTPPLSAAPAEALVTSVLSARKWRRLVERPSRFAVLALAALFLAAAGALAFIAWRNTARLDEIALHTRHTARIGATSLRLQESLVEELAGRASGNPAAIDELRDEAVGIRAAGLHLDPATSHRLEQLGALLADAPLPVVSQIAALRLSREILDAEHRAEARMLERIDGDARAEFQLVFGLLGSGAALAGFGLWTLRRRIVGPLYDLSGLLTLLGEGEFRAIEAEGAHPLLEPLFRHYNYLVTRLAELEAEHRSRARSLEAEVRSATHALLDQQRTLARAERLAALGEMAGSVAHEVRNPLAGLAMCLGNLRREVGAPELAERIDLALAEIERLTRMLNGALSAARHAPEVSREVDLHALVSELLGLVRYQAPEHVQLECGVPAGLSARLPRDRVRQALLNLVLNAVQALGETPGRIAVTSRREADRLRLSVCDDGPGFPPERLAGGIQPFATQREGGSGLGLAIVRRLVLDLGGELRLANLEPRGASVDLILPGGLG